MVSLAQGFRHRDERDLWIELQPREKKVKQTTIKNLLRPLTSPPLCDVEPRHVQHKTTCTRFIKSHTELWPGYAASVAVNTFYFVCNMCIHSLCEWMCVYYPQLTTFGGIFTGCKLRPSTRAIRVRTCTHVCVCPFKSHLLTVPNVF